MSSVNFSVWKGGGGFKSVNLLFLQHNSSLALSNSKNQVGGFQRVWAIHLYPWRTTNISYIPSKMWNILNNLCGISISNYHFHSGQKHAVSRLILFFFVYLSNNLLFLVNCRGWWHCMGNEISSTTCLLWFRVKTYLFIIFF